MTNRVIQMPSPSPAPLLQSQPPMSQYQQLAQMMAPQQQPSSGGGMGGALGGLNLAQLSQILKQQQGAPGQTYTGAAGPFGNNTPGGLAVGGGSQSYAP